MIETESMSRDGVSPFHQYLVYIYNLYRYKIMLKCFSPSPTLNPGVRYQTGGYELSSSLKNTLVVIYHNGGIKKKKNLVRFDKRDKGRSYQTLLRLRGRGLSNGSESFFLTRIRTQKTAQKNTDGHLAFEKLYHILPPMLIPETSICLHSNFRPRWP